MKTNIIAKVNDVNIVCIGSEELIPVLHLAQALGIYDIMKTKTFEFNGKTIDFEINDKLHP